MHQVIRGADAEGKLVWINTRYITHILPWAWKDVVNAEDSYLIFFISKESIRVNRDTYESVLQELLNGY